MTFLYQPSHPHSERKKYIVLLLAHSPYLILVAFRFERLTYSFHISRRAIARRFAVGICVPAASTLTRRMHSSCYSICRFFLAKNWYPLFISNLFDL